MVDSGNGLQEQLKSLWHAGMVRHVYVRKDEHTPVDLPLLVVIVVGMFAPWLLGIGLVIALLLGYRFEVENTEETAAAASAGGDDLPTATLAPLPGEDAVPPEATEGGEPRG